MTLDELIQELASCARFQNDDFRKGERLFIIEKRLGDGIDAKNLDKIKIIKMIRKMRNDMLLWCDDIISFANEEN